MTLNLTNLFESLSHVAFSAYLLQVSTPRSCFNIDPESSHPLASFFADNYGLSSSSHSAGQAKLRSNRSCGIGIEVGPPILDFCGSAFTESSSEWLNRIPSETHQLGWTLHLIPNLRNRTPGHKKGPTKSVPAPLNCGLLAPDLVTKQ